MNENSGILLPVQEAYGAYLKAWHGGLYGDTASTAEFAARDASSAIMWAPGRMVDAAEEMLELYRKASIGAPGANALFPVVLVAMARDYTPVPSAFGHQVGDRQLVSLVDDPNASVYGYRQAMAEIRTQIAICASDAPSAKSLAAQFDLYVGAIPRRRFKATHQWGQYTLPLPVMVETPEITWQDVKTDQQNLILLVGDVILRAVLPFLDAPKPGEPNDGTSNNPPGYPVIAEVATEETQLPINP